MFANHPYLITFLLGILLMPIGYYAGRKENATSGSMVFMAAEVVYVVYVVYVLFGVLPNADSLMISVVSLSLLVFPVLGFFAFLKGNRVYLRARSRNP